MCEICSSDEEKYISVIEGAEMRVCERCKTLGKIKKVIVVETLNKQNKAKQIQLSQKRKEVLEESDEIVIKDFANIIKREREKRGMKQKEFANLLNIKESIIHNIESARFIPQIDVVKKLEKILNIKLIEKESEGKITYSQNKSK